MSVSVYQGNDKILLFTRKNKKGEIITSLPQNLWFTLKKATTNTSPILQKKMFNGIEQTLDGSWKIILTHTDTGDMIPGVYTCDVKVKNEVGNEYTIVPPQDFIVKSVVTKRENQGE